MSTQNEKEELYLVNYDHVKERLKEFECTEAQINKILHLSEWEIELTFPVKNLKVSYDDLTIHIPGKNTGDVPIVENFGVECDWLNSARIIKIEIPELHVSNRDIPSVKITHEMSGAVSEIIKYFKSKKAKRENC